jgi:hypothetical protein
LYTWSLRHFIAGNATKQGPDNVLNMMQLVCPRKWSILKTIWAVSQDKKEEESKFKAFTGKPRSLRD